MSMRVAIAGASGFVGHHLMDWLGNDPGIGLVRGLSRSKVATSSKSREHLSCDLFSLKDVDEGLRGIDEALYLVHSMLPSSELAQGSFEDYDLILADNFARACVKNNVRRVTYLSGIIPPAAAEHPERLSKHLRSRLEVENIFRAYGLPLVSLRAGIIIGPGGSSFEMILRLVHRLPVMICPAWTQCRSNPIHVRDVGASFRHVLRTPELRGTFDLAGPDSLSYRDMIQRSAAHFHRHPLLLNIPFFSPQLSKLWVCAITGAPASLVYPLIESLKHEMLANPETTLHIPGHVYTSFEAALSELPSLRGSAERAPKAYRVTASTDRAQVVQSVQRLPLPAGLNAEGAAKLYTTFLNHDLGWFLRVTTEGNRTTFRLRGIPFPMLILDYSAERSAPDRVLFYIKGGLLDRGRTRARLEFRKCRHEPSLVVAIHDFRPRLPWYFYKFTQALFHLRVMRAFGRHLKSTKSVPGP